MKINKNILMSGVSLGTMKVFMDTNDQMAAAQSAEEIGILRIASKDPEWARKNAERVNQAVESLRARGMLPAATSTVEAL